MVTDTPTRYHPRRPLSLPGQTELHVPGIRPDRGHCPECGAPEDVYCGPDCSLADPYGDRSLFARPRCLRCQATRDETARRYVTILLAPRGTPRLHLAGEHLSACNLLRADGALRYEDIRW